MARKKSTIPPELLDKLLAGRDPQSIFSREGLFDELKKAMAERILNAELEHHLDTPEEEATGNHKNGTSSKTVLTDTGSMEDRKSVV